MGSKSCVYRSSKFRSCLYLQNDGTVIEFCSDKRNLYQCQLPALETIGRMGTSFGRNDFWNGIGGQALVIIGRWFPRQPLTNHK